MPAYFKPSNTLQQLPVHPRDKVEKGKVVRPVYHIQCEDCDASYVGETERALTTHFQEHCRWSSMTSEVLQHITKVRQDHDISLDSVSILTVENKKFVNVV